MASIRFVLSIALLIMVAGCWLLVAAVRKPIQNQKVPPIGWMT